MQLMLNIRALCAWQQLKHVRQSLGFGGQISSHAVVLQLMPQQCPHAFPCTKPTHSGWSAEGHGWLPVTAPKLDAHCVDAFGGLVHAGWAAKKVPRPALPTPTLPATLSTASGQLHSRSSGSRARLLICRPRPYAP